MAFAGKVVIVTGSSSGIGASAAIEFAKRGASVVVTGRNVENLKKTEDQCKSVKSDSAQILSVQADVTKEEDLKKIVAETIKTFGRLDVLVNNAGIFERGGVEEATLEQYDRIFNTNLRAVLALTKFAIPHLEKTKGSIVNVSSLAGKRSVAGVLNYCMAKAALDQFTRCVALDLASKKIRVNAINPGVIETDIFRRLGLNEKQIEEFYKDNKAKYPLGRIGQPEETANLIAFLASDEAGFITGETISIDGGMHAVCIS